MKGTIKIFNELMSPILLNQKFSLMVQWIVVSELMGVWD
jgi:hypothetical protein